MFITPPELNTLTNTTIMPMQYNNLKAHIRYKIGHNKHYDAIPSMNMPQKNRNIKFLGNTDLYYKKLSHST